MQVESLGCHFPREEGFVSETWWEISADFFPLFGELALVLSDVSHMLGTFCERREVM